MIVLIVYELPDKNGFGRCIKHRTELINQPSGCSMWTPRRTRPKDDGLYKLDLKIKIVRQSVPHTNLFTTKLDDE